MPVPEELLLQSGLDKHGNNCPLTKPWLSETSRKLELLLLVGSEDNEIHIKGLPADRVEDSEDEKYTSEEDSFAGCSDDSDN